MNRPLVERGTREREKRKQRNREPVHRLWFHKQNLPRFRISQATFPVRRRSAPVLVIKLKMTSWIIRKIDMNIIVPVEFIFCNKNGPRIFLKAYTYLTWQGGRFDTTMLWYTFFLGNLRNFKNALRINPRLKFWRGNNFVWWKSVKTIQLYVFNLFFCFNSKTTLPAESLRSFLTNETLFEGYGKTT